MGFPWNFIIPAAASLLGAKSSSSAAKKAAAISAAATDRATELQQRVYEESIARQKPFLETGTDFFNRLAALQRGGPDAPMNFLQMDPGYGFRLGEGLKAIERSAAARGLPLAWRPARRRGYGALSAKRCRHPRHWTPVPKQRTRSWTNPGFK